MPNTGLNSLPERFFLRRRPECDPGDCCNGIEQNQVKKVAYVEEDSSQYLDLSFLDKVRAAGAMS